MKKTRHCVFCECILSYPSEEVCGVCHVTQSTDILQWVCTQCTYSGNGYRNTHCASCENERENAGVVDVKEIVASNTNKPTVINHQGQCLHPCDEDAGVVGVKTVVARS